MVEAIRWAPLGIPLERRLQTAAVFIGLLVLPTLVLTAYAALLYWGMSLASQTCMAGLLVFQYLDRHTPSRGGRVIRWVRQSRLWWYAKRYFPAQLHVPPGPQPYDPARPHIFCCHPHGIISIGALSNILWDVDGNQDAIGVPYRVATVTANFLLPIWRELLMALGFVSASRQSISYLLSHGTSAVIVIGGARETLYAKPGVAELVLSQRKGFVKLALQHGARLVPVFHFGENELYGQVTNPWLAPLQHAMIRYFGFTLPVIRGRGVFQYDWGVLPRRQPLHTVMGTAIDIPHIPHPTTHDIDTYHAMYVRSLKQLYDDNKDKYYKPTDFKGRPLEVQPLRIVD